MSDVIQDGFLVSWLQLGLKDVFLGLHRIILTTNVHDGALLLTVLIKRGQINDFYA